MRFRQVATIPVVVAIGLSGAVAFGGCGSDSNAATKESTTDSMHHSAMKHEGEAMKHDDKSMHHGETSGDHMEG
jgi:hypothetical protein